MPDSQNNLVLYGSQGCLVGTAALWEARQGMVQVVSETVQKTAIYDYNLLANYVDELGDFHQAIAEQREPAATGLDGLRAVQVTLAMIVSAREGRTVPLTPITV